MKKPHELPDDQYVNRALEPADLNPTEMLTRAATLCQSGSSDEAITLCKNVLAAIPNHFIAMNIMGLAYVQQNRPEEAIAILEKARSINDQFPDTYYLQGRALHQLNRHHNALPYFDRAVVISPTHAAAYFYLGVSQQHLKRYAEALQSYDKALALNPHHADTYQNRGTTLFSLKRYDEALLSLNNAVALAPHSADAYHNRAGIFHKTKRYHEALADYDKAITANPDYTEAHLIKGLIKLSLGEYEEGWKLYEWRWKGGEASHKVRNFQNPLWLGKEKLDGKTILLHAEQGLGDTLQFCRYAILVEKLGANVILEVQKPLAALLASLKGNFTIVPQGNALPAFDFHCPLLSLPLALKTSKDTIPAPIPYIYSAPANFDKWHSRLGKKNKPRIGLVWSGTAGHINDHNRSIPLQMLASLLECGFEFHSLQKDVRAQDAEFLKGSQIIAHEDHLQDFTDTASLVSEMDLIISVDTSVVHLAGALGKPVWVLLPYVPDWRWLANGEDSLWYPSAKLFRQPALDDWASVIGKVKAELRKMSGLPEDTPSLTQQLMKAIALHQAGNLHEAEAIYKNMLTAHPDNADALNLLGTIRLQQGKLEESIKLLEKAIVNNPNYAEAYNNRGTALHTLKRYSDAVASYNNAITLKPDYAEAYYNRGLSFYEFKQYHEALADYDKAIALRPKHFLAYYNRGIVFYDLKQYGKAIASYDNVIAINPDYKDVYWNKGVCKLALGEYEEGWKLHEWRWTTKPMTKLVRTLGKPLWLGDEPLTGKTILLYAEQGLGDALQFCRYAPMIESLGAKVILEVHGSLTRLLATLKGSYTIIAQGSALPEFDFHCPLMSLPLALKTTMDTIPANMPYLFTDKDNHAMWKDRLGARTRPRIGLACSGNPQHVNDSNRSIALSMLAPLLQYDFEFHSLQSEMRAQDKAFLSQSRIISHEGNLHDFLDTASLMSEMDIIISVDTSVAHLAGAMSKKLWLLLPCFGTDWRWLMEREDSPWYPTARLFRQQKPGDWESVIEKVETELTLPGT